MKRVLVMAGIILLAATVALAQNAGSSSAKGPASFDVNRDR